MFDARLTLQSALHDPGRGRLGKPAAVAVAWPRSGSPTSSMSSSGFRFGVRAGGYVFSSAPLDPYSRLRQGDRRHGGLSTIRSRAAPRSESSSATICCCPRGPCPGRCCAPSIAGDSSRARRPSRLISRCSGSAACARRRVIVRGQIAVDEGSVGRVAHAVRSRTSSSERRSVVASAR